MSTTYPIVRTAVKKLGAKTFALISPEHEHKPVKRGDMVKIKVEQEGPGKPFVEISSDQSVGEIVASNNLRSIVRAIRNADANRKMLVDAALKMKNGLQTLETLGLYDSADEPANVVEDEDSVLNPVDDDFVDVDALTTGQSNLAQEVDGLTEVELEPGSDGDNVPDLKESEI